MSFTVGKGEVVSRRSARFFLDWVQERTEILARALKDDPEKEAVLAHHERARKFWKAKLDAATAP